MKRILVPLDGTRDAEAALPVLRTLIGRRPAGIVLLTSVLPLPPVHAEPSGVLFPADNRIEEGAETYLKSLAQSLTGEGHSARILIRRGSPVETILDVAATENVTMIAMATQGRRGLNRLLFPSVAERVARRAPIPVLVMRSAGLPLEPAFNRIVLALADEESLGVLPAVIDIAVDHASEVVIVHVVDDWNERAAFPHLAFDRAMEALTDAGLHHRCAVRTGEAAHQILAAARLHRAGLIAMASHGRCGLARLFRGSVAERALRDACVPLLIARARKTEAAAEPVKRIAVA